MKEDALPSNVDLEDIKIKLKKKSDHDGLEEDLLRGYPELFPGEIDSVWGHLKWRFTKWFIGKIHRGKRVSGKGWMLILGLTILSVFVYGDSNSPYFADTMATFLIFFIPTILGWYFIVMKNHYVGAIEQVEAGEMVPVAYEKDETGRYNFKFERAKSSYTDVHRIPEEALDFLMMFCVAEQKDSANKPVYRFKAHYHNVAWGSLAYADLDTDEFHLTAPQVTILPENLQKAMDRFGKVLKRDELSEEDRSYILDRVKEMYAAAQIIDENEKELIEIAGKRMIKIKKSKHTQALFMSWESNIRELDKVKKKLFEGFRKDKNNIIGSFNRARLAQLENANIPQMLKENEVKVTKKVATNLEKVWMGGARDTVEVAQASRENISRGAAQTEQNQLDAEFKKKLREELLGESSDE